MASYPDHAAYAKTGGSPSKTLPPRGGDGRFLTNDERKAESMRREAAALGASKVEDPTAPASSLLSAPIKPRIKRTSAGSF